MKKLFYLTAFLLMLNISYAQENSNLRRIEVFGTSTIKVKPDMLNWSVSIQYESNNVSEIKKEIDQATGDVLTVLRLAGVKSEDIQTEGIMVYKNYVDPNNPGKKYSGSNRVMFVLRDISKYEDIADELFKIENVFTSAPAFEYSGAIETRQKAREEALLAAKKKAGEMALVMSVNLGRVMVIEEQPVDYSPMITNMNIRGEYTSSQESTFSEGLINVESRVRVVFEIQ